MARSLGIPAVLRHKGVTGLWETVNEQDIGGSTVADIVELATDGSGRVMMTVREVVGSARDQYGTTHYNYRITTCSLDRGALISLRDDIDEALAVVMGEDYERNGRKPRGLFVPFALAGGLDAVPALEMLGDSGGEPEPPDEWEEGGDDDDAGEDR